jgi:agmatinase
MVKKVYERVRHLLADKKFVVTLGGDHSVSVPSIRAHSEAFKEMSVLHLDAHSDRREEYEDNRYSHACVISRAKESVKNVVSVGVRSMDSSELEIAKKDRIFYAHEIHGKTDWIKKVVDSLSDNVYVTIDLDVFEIGLMPSTGTPEPGGLGWYEVTRLLRAVAEKKNVVGFDVVELCPNERNKAPDALAAKLVQVLLSYVFFGK